MRTSHALALVLGVGGLGTACGGDGNGPSNTPPAAAFTPSCVLLVCTFADGSTDADGQVTAYTWDFGDGAAAVTTKDAQHTFGAANTYAVSLTVTDDDGATARVTRSIQVTAPANAPPTAGFTSSCADLTCSFTDISSDGDGTILGFHWDFGDGAEAATQNATHTYASAGTYVVELTVTDDGGTTGRRSQEVTVTEPQAVGPTANFAGSCVVVGHFGRIVFVDCTFTDHSTAAAGATVTGWAWDFGDGRTSTEQNPPVQHYSLSLHPGMHVTARLTVTDNNGLTSGVTTSVRVGTQANAPPTASFAAPVITLGLPIGFVRTGSNLCYPAISYSTRGGCYSSVNLSISNAGGGTLNWTGTTSATWLKISPKSGTAPSTMKVWVDGTGVAPGSYDGEIRISATGATNSPQTITVHFTRR